MKQWKKYSSIGKEKKVVDDEPAAILLKTKEKSYSRLLMGRLWMSLFLFGIISSLLWLLLRVEQLADGAELIKTNRKTKLGLHFLILIDKSTPIVSCWIKFFGTLNKTKSLVKDNKSKLANQFIFTIFFLCYLCCVHLIYYLFTALLYVHFAQKFKSNSQHNPIIIIKAQTDSSQISTGNTAYFSLVAVCWVFQTMKEVGLA